MSIGREGSFEVQQHGDRGRAIKCRPDVFVRTTLGKAETGQRYWKAYGDEFVCLGVLMRKHSCRGGWSVQFAGIDGSEISFSQSGNLALLEAKQKPGVGA